MTGCVCSHCWAGVLALSDADGLLECCVVWWQAQSSLLPSWRCFPVSQLDLEVIEWGGGSCYSTEWNVKHFLLPQASALQRMENQPLSSNANFTALQFSVKIIQVHDEGRGFLFATNSPCSSSSLKWEQSYSTNTPWVCYICQSG